MQSELLALAERLEGLSGPDRDIDTEILWHLDRAAFSCGYWNAASGMPRELDRMPSKDGGLGWIGAQCNAPAYTASIDAAITSLGGGPNAWRRLTETAVAVYDASPYNAAAQIRYDGIGATVPIQMIAAELKRRAAHEAKALRAPAGKEQR